MEQIVRHFVVTSKPEFRVATPPPKEQPQAFIRWGQSAAFEEHEFRYEASRQPWLGVSEADPEPPKRKRVHYTCIGRGYELNTYTNPNDVDQYVIVAQVTSLRFQGRNGDEFSLQIDKPMLPHDPPGSGQEPEEPPPLTEIGERQQWVAWKNSQSG